MPVHPLFPDNGGGSVTSYAGIVYLDSVNGDDSNDGKSSFGNGTGHGPIATPGQALTLADNGYLIWVSPLSSFPTFNVTVSKNVTFYSPMIGGIPGASGAGAQGQPYFGGTFTVATGDSVGRLYLYNLNCANTAGVNSVIMNTSNPGTPNLYAFNCAFNMSTNGAMSGGLTLSGIKNVNGTVVLEECYGNLNRGDAAASGVGAIVYVTGSAANTTYIRNCKFSVSHVTDNILDYAVYSDNTATSPKSIINLEKNYVTLGYASNTSTAQYVGKAATSTTIIKSSNDTCFLYNAGTIATVTLFSSNSAASGFIQATNFYCDYGALFGTPFPDVNVNLATTGASTDRISVTGFLNTSGNVGPVCTPTGGAATIKFNIINGILKKVSSSQLINTQGSNYTVLATDWGDGAYLMFGGTVLTLTASASMLPAVGGVQPNVFITVANTGGAPVTVVVQGADVLHGTTIAANAVARIYYEGIIGGNGSYRIG